MTYVYPVVSRRAKGVSVGINLNPNNACNWRCIYCQVPNLTRGGPPPIDLALLEAELRAMLGEIVHGDFMARRVPEDMRVLHDVAFSGNGEPTSAREFPQVVSLVGQVLEEFGLLARGIKLVLITNGSLIHRQSIQAGIAAMQKLNGEVWFKFDRATKAGMRFVNDTDTTPERHFQRLKTVAGLCPTWIQTCMFAWNGQPPASEEIQAYLEMIARCLEQSLPIKGVLLYGLARPPLQPEAPHLEPLPPGWLHQMADRIKALGMNVRLSI